MSAEKGEEHWQVLSNDNGNVPSVKDEATPAEAAPLSRTCTARKTLKLLLNNNWKVLLSASLIVFLHYWTVNNLIQAQDKRLQQSQEQWKKLRFENIFSPLREHAARAEAAANTFERRAQELESLLNNRGDFFHSDADVPMPDREWIEERIQLAISAATLDIKQWADARIGEAFLHQTTGENAGENIYDASVKEKLELFNEEFIGIGGALRFLDEHICKWFDRIEFDVEYLEFWQEHYDETLDKVEEAVKVLATRMNDNQVKVDKHDLAIGTLQASVAALQDIKGTPPADRADEKVPKRIRKLSFSSHGGVRRVVVI